MKTVPIVGYCNKLSGRPGDIIEFKVSSKLNSHYTASLKRSISADPNPKGIGIVEDNCDFLFKPRQIQSREQAFYPGSYGRTKTEIYLRPESNLTISVTVFPTLINKKTQAIFSLGNISINYDKNGHVNVVYGDQIYSTKKKLPIKKWYKINLEIDRSDTISLTITIIQLKKTVKSYTYIFENIEEPFKELTSAVIIGASANKNSIENFFNGKIESPLISQDGKTLATWDFSNSISNTYVKGTNCSELQLINFPTRAVTSSLWDGSEMNWNHKPCHYAAIHFHEDDIYDFKWETDFIFKIPKSMKSGIYVMKLECETHEDAIPFFVCPEIGENAAKLCVLVSTFTYSIYGNHSRPDYSKSWQSRIKKWNAYPYNPAEYKNYGLSTYNYHSDGSGICHSSFKRPLFNLRPGYLTFGNSNCSGLRHFQADSHLISWLHEKGIDYDIITDEELHNDGYNAIKNYLALTTGTHPEYHTTETLDALKTYRDNGGALNYLGGNGFYWKIARHKEQPDILEIRRAEDGIRAWASQPGEYYNAFDGGYGGLWRRNARPPQQLVGIGFTAQGTFIGMPFKRTNYEASLEWIFDGIDEEIIGDFGFSGDGAAGFELDRVDRNLDEGHNIKIIAQSIDKKKNFMLVPEEQLTHLTNISGGPEDCIRRADMIYFEVEGGGCVFSVGSITFCGCLPWNNFDNNVSKLLLNVFSKHLKKN